MNTYDTSQAKTIARLFVQSVNYTFKCKIEIKNGSYEFLKPNTDRFVWTRIKQKVAHCLINHHLGVAHSLINQ